MGFVRRLRTKLIFLLHRHRHLLAQREQKDGDDRQARYNCAVDEDAIKTRREVALAHDRGDANDLGREHMLEQPADDAGL